MRPFPRSTTLRRGMTLLEVTATLAIFGALVVMLLNIVSSSIQARHTVETNISVIDRAYGAMDAIVKDLETMHVSDDRAYLLAEENRIYNKNVTSIAFSCLTPVRVSEQLRERPGLVEIAYLVGPQPGSDNQLRLFRRELEIETNHDARQIRFSDEGLVLLVEHVDDFHLEFLSKEAAEEAREVEGLEPEWTEQWVGGFGPENLPEAIRIVMTAGGEKVGAPDMTLHRTVRLADSDVEKSMLQATLEESLGLGE